MSKLLDRLPIIADLLLGDYADVLSGYDRDFLATHRQRGDWVHTDVTLVHEMLPPCLRAALELPDEDDEGPPF